MLALIWFGRDRGVGGFDPTLARANHATGDDGGGASPKPPFDQFQQSTFKLVTFQFGHAII